MWRSLTLLLIAVGFAFAQNISSSLSGTVADGSGAVVPGAKVAVTATESGFVRTTVTNQDGFFSFPDLTPATFSINISAPGFRQYIRKDMQITSGESRSLEEIRLEVGDTGQTIVITADAPTVDTGTSDRANTLTTKDLETLSTRGRDFMDAVALLPGIVDTTDARESPQPSSIGGIYILGGRSSSKNMAIDGVTNMDTGSNGSVHSMPSMDSISELKVQMSQYSAEDGRNSGGAIQVITKSGGRQFHGGAGWYHRHEQFSANDFFNNRDGIQRPRYRYNIFSYNLGGPVVVPKLLPRSRSKVFFFFSQEFQEQLVTFTAKKVRVPTALERMGDFSQSYDVNGKLKQINDPLNAKKAFPGNVIPASRINSIGQNILNMFPLPNFRDSDPARMYSWNFISQLSTPYPRRTEIARLDYSPRDNTQLYLRLSNNADEQHPPYTTWVTGSVNFPLTPITFRAPGRGATLHGAVTLSPTLFVEFIGGVSQNKLWFYPDNTDAVSRDKLGIDLPQFYPGLNPLRLIPNMTFSSVTNYANPSMNNGNPYYNSNTIFSFLTNVSKVVGPHVLKAGIYIERTRKDQSASSATRGSLSFDQDSNNPLDANWAYANALLGNFNSYSEANARPQGQYRFTNLEWYVQDSWRVTPRFTLDIGVRFYHDPPQHDARYQLSSFAPGLYDPAQAPILYRPALDAKGNKVAVDPRTGQFFSDALTGTYVPGAGDLMDGIVVGGKNGWPDTMYTIAAVNAAPRFGFAYDPFGRGRTALRGGFGTNFDRIQGNPVMGLLTNPPTIYTPTVYYNTLDSLKDAASRNVLAPSSSITSMIGQQSLPITYKFSFDIQQQVGRSTTVTIGYVGTLSRHLLWERNINAVPGGARFLDLHPENKNPTSTSALPPNFLRPYPGFGDIFLFEFGSTANYNSLQTTINRRFSRGSLFSISYTFSKVLGTANSDTSTVSPSMDPRSRNYGPLSYDRRQILSARYSYAFPRLMRDSGRGLRPVAWLANGWELSGTYRFTTGEPFTPGYSSVDGQDITGTPSESARTDVRDPSADPVNRFGRPARGTYGNAGIGVIEAPGINNFDTSLFRQIRFAERRTLQLRFESYNTLNHTQFSDVNRTAKFDKDGNQVDPLFLQPLTARSPRRIQIALRYSF